jgi:hypothetical protein
LAWTRRRAAGVGTPGCDATEAAEGVRAVPPRWAGERTNEAAAIMASSGTVPSAQAHALDASGFDKTILLMTIR